MRAPEGGLTEAVYTQLLTEGGSTQRGDTGAHTCSRLGGPPSSVSLMSGKRELENIGVFLFRKCPLFISGNGDIFKSGSQVNKSSIQFIVH